MVSEGIDRPESTAARGARRGGGVRARSRRIGSCFEPRTEAFEESGSLGNGVLGVALGDVDGAFVDVPMAEIAQLLEVGDEIGRRAECVLERFEHEAMLAGRIDSSYVLGTEERDFGSPMLRLVCFAPRAGPTIAETERGSCAIWCL